MILTARRRWLAGDREQAKGRVLGQTLTAPADPGHHRNDESPRAVSVTAPPSGHGPPEPSGLCSRPLTGRTAAPRLPDKPTVDSGRLLSAQTLSGAVWPFPRRLLLLAVRPGRAVSRATFAADDSGPDPRRASPLTGAEPKTR